MNTHNALEFTDMKFWPVGLLPAEDFTSAALLEWSMFLVNESHADFVLVIMQIIKNEKYGWRGHGLGT